MKPVSEHNAKGTGRRTEDRRATSGGTLCSCKATEITLIKCGEAIKALVWIVVLFLTFSFMCVSVCVSAVGDPFPCSLTCDHDPVVHTGGQLWVLQACRLAGVGWAQPESARSSTWVWLLLRTQPTCRVCSPPPQLRLHTPHLPTDQLGRHKRNAAESTGSSSIAHYRLQAARWWRNLGRRLFVSLRSEWLHLWSGLCSAAFTKCVTSDQTALI